MQVIKRIFIYISVLCCLSGCIEPYFPEIDEGRDLLVINGRITDLNGYQYVEVSRSSDLSEPKKNPVSGCIIQIVDDHENVFDMTEVEKGRYACHMSKDNLIIGTKYKLIVTTPENKHYQSDYEELLSCPPIDSITYEEAQIEVYNPIRNMNMVQFYVYTDASGEYAKNFLWEMTDAWEYHSNYFIYVYYDGSFTELEFPLMEYYTCYKSGRIEEIYTHSTRNTSNNKIQKFPLNYVTDQEDRLSVKYSLNVRQYSLSNKVYNYLNTIKQLSKETGGLYEIQPSSIPGNIYNQDDPEENVIGMFYASSVTEKRIFVRALFKTHQPACIPYGFDRDGLLEFLSDIDKSEYPVFLFLVDGGVYDYADQECFDCRKLGGTTSPPDFWE
jgi:hypothetical protein